MTSNYFCYSTIIQDYDIPPNVIDADSRIQFIIFSDSLSTAPMPWKLAKVENYFSDPKITAGFLKSNPEMLFERNAKVVWVDGNLRDIKIDTDQIDNWLCSAPIVSIPHRVRNSAADELAECLRCGIEDDISANRLMAEMRDAGFHDNCNLSATMLLVRDLNDHRVRRADGFWWDAILSGGRRDQISFEFAVWSAGLVSAKIGVNWMEQNLIFTRSQHKNEEGHQLPPRLFSPQEIERRWRTLNFPSLPENYPKPSYFRERWTSTSLQIIREINAAVIASGETLEGNYCYFHEHQISERSPPDPRRSWKRQVLRAASGAGYRALEIGFNAGHSAVIMLDANPLLHLTSLDVGSHSYTESCVNVVNRHFSERFSFLSGRSKTQLAKIDEETARQFDIIHIDGGHDEATVIDDFEWVMRKASAGCCIIIDDAYVEQINRLIGEAIQAGQMRPALLPIPSSGENRVFFKTNPGDARRQVN